MVHRNLRLDDRIRSTEPLHQCRPTPKKVCLFSHHSYICPFRCWILDGIIHHPLTLWLTASYPSFVHIPPLLLYWLAHPYHNSIKSIQKTPTQHFGLSYLSLSPRPYTHRTHNNNNNDDHNSKTNHNERLLQQFRNGNLLPIFRLCLIAISSNNPPNRRQQHNRSERRIRWANIRTSSRNIRSANPARSGRISAEQWTTVDFAVVRTIKYPSLPTLYPISAQSLNSARIRWYIYIYLFLCVFLWERTRFFKDRWFMIILYLEQTNLSGNNRKYCVE